MPIEPAQFDDELAMRTQWSPVVKGGSHVGTHDLKEVSPDRLVFTPTPTSQLSVWTMLGIGIAIPVAALLNMNEGVQLDDDNFIAAAAICIFASGFFVAAGLIMRNGIGRSHTFDRRSGKYWNTRKEPVSPARGADKAVSLDQIYALQIIEEHFPATQKQRRYNSYELNLVLDDASRINIIDHTEANQVRSEAGKLARFLGDIPLWDASR